MSLSPTFFSDAGGAVKDLFSSQGSAAEASAYNQAATLATQNEQIEKSSVAIQTAQQGRNIYQTIGAQQAGVGGAGLAESGSALNLLASSRQQGALTLAATKAQGLIQENAYASQAASYTGMAQAAQAASEGEMGGGILSGLGAVFGGGSGGGSIFGSIGGLFGL